MTSNKDTSAADLSAQDLEILSNSPNTSSSQNEDSPKLTQEQTQRMERNRKRALELKSQRENVAKAAKIVLNGCEPQKLIDTGAGFYLDENDLIEEKVKETKIVEIPPVPTQDQQLTCERCNDRFPHSFLSLNFDLSVCDSCKTEFADDYKLITKTDAKTEFLLSDYDMDRQEPPLKFIVKRNPHKNRFAHMKLYLRRQCEQRAMLIHEDKEKLEEKKELKVVNLQKARQKNYEKKLDKLRKDALQGSKKLTEFHQHDYGEELYNEEDDVYYQECKTCSHRNEYEKF